MYFSNRLIPIAVALLLGLTVAISPASAACLASGKFCGASTASNDRLCCPGMICGPLGNVCQAGCRINNVAYRAGAINPANRCQVCQPSTSTTRGSNVANGTACGSSSDAECDNPDSCQNGTCVPNYEPAGAPCGYRCDTFCNAPDTCDGSGSCVDRKKPEGTVCLAGTGPCDADDTCDGRTSDCVAVYTPAGTPCPLPYADARCDGSGVCTVNSCESGFLDCNSISGDGCETNIFFSDPGNCGGCGVACPSGHSCSAGACLGVSCEGGVVPTQIPAGADFTEAGTTVGLATLNGGNCGGSGPERIYVILPTPAARTITASLCGSAYDTVLYVRAGDCSSGTQVACNDDICSLQSEVSFAAAANTTYFLFVDGFGLRSGAFSLRVTGL